MSFSTATPQLSTFEVQLLSYAGEGSPVWSKNNSGNYLSHKPGGCTNIVFQGSLLDGFRYVCRITADLSSLSGALEHKSGQRGTTYWYLGFEVCIRFGGTELEAFIEWKERVSPSND